MIEIPKKWRELSIKEKLDLPVSYFGFDKRKIEQIRAISNRKKKIFEAAKLQFDKYGDIHSFLTTWIAGYSSDVAPRQIFGSMRDLRKLFLTPQKISGVEFSWKDLQRGIKISRKMTSELAEETGIHLGDGCISIYIDPKGYRSFRFSITGDLIDESIYHENFILPLLKKLYNIDASILKRPEKNSIETKINSKAIIQFKNELLGLPIGDKKNAQIPSIILKNNEFAKRCLVGIFDTDFHITEVLSISGKLHSLKLAEQVHNILERNKIKHIYRVYKDYARFYVSKKDSEFIVKKWQMHNQKHLSKFEVFEKFNVFIPFSRTQERLDLLSGKISIKYLKNVCNKRRKLKNNTFPRGLEPRTP